MHRFSTATYSNVLNTCVANFIEIWNLAHLHAYFVLHISKEVQVEFVFYYLLIYYVPTPTLEFQILLL